MHAMRDVKPGDLVKRKSDGTIHTVAMNDPGACQISLVALPLDPKDPDYGAKAAHIARNGAPAKPLQAWDDFEAYEPKETDPFPVVVAKTPSRAPKGAA